MEVPVSQHTPQTVVTSSAKEPIIDGEFVFVQRHAEVGLLILFLLFTGMFSIGYFYFSTAALFWTLAVVFVLVAIPSALGTDFELAVSTAGGSSVIRRSRRFAFIPFFRSTLVVVQGDILIQRTRAATESEVNQPILLGIVLIPVCVGLFLLIFLIAARESLKKCYWVELEIKSSSRKGPFRLYKNAMPGFQGGPIPDEAAEIAREIERLTGLPVSKHHHKSTYFPNRTY